MTDAIKQVIAVLNDLSPELICMASHHAKKDQHAINEECPVAARYTAALAALRAQPIDMEKNHDDYVKSYERAQPDGWKLVPIEPTDEILQAMAEMDGYFDPSDRDYPDLQPYRDVWEKAIEAATKGGSNACVNFKHNRL